MSWAFRWEILFNELYLHVSLTYGFENYSYFKISLYAYFLCFPWNLQILDFWWNKYNNSVDEINALKQGL